MAHKLIVLFDGTWNTPEDHTNVARLAQRVAVKDAEGAEQRSFYDKGVGTHALDRLTGGIFGYGLSDNIRQGYKWLATQYRPGAELFLFGFSRGAYTARSLAGLIRKCGLLRTADGKTVGEAYDLYRDKTIAPDHADAVAFRARHAIETRIRFIGVWDTVGSLGVPVSAVPFSRDYYRWHDTKLSKIVDYAYQALALDEHREDFAPAVWTERKPENVDIEQRWFAGSHSNVGGGYRRDPMPNLALRWLANKARDCGLSLNGEVAVGPDDHLAPIRDSYSEFAYGLYKLIKAGKRFHRPFGNGVNETVDQSVWRRFAADAGYRPQTLNGVAQPA